MENLSIPDGAEIWVEATVTGIAFPKHSDEPRLVGTVETEDGGIPVGPEDGRGILRSAPYVDMHGLRGRIFLRGETLPKSVVAVDGKKVGRLRANTPTPYVDVRGRHIGVALGRGEALRACTLETPVVSVVLTLRQLLERQPRPDGAPDWRAAGTHKLVEYLDECLPFGDDAWRKLMGKAVHLFPGFGSGNRYGGRDRDR